MDPNKIAEGTDELSQQAALIVWKQSKLAKHPELRWLHHIPNGGKRGDTARSAKIAGNEMKMAGVTKGVLDLFWPYPRQQNQLAGALWESLVTPINGLVCGLYIEMKRPGAKSDTSKEQDEFIALHRNLGYACVVCDTYEEAKFFVCQYGGITE